MAFPLLNEVISELNEVISKMSGILGGFSLAIVSIPIAKYKLELKDYGSLETISQSIYERIQSVGYRTIFTYRAPIDEPIADYGKDRIISKLKEWLAGIYKENDSDKFKKLLSENWVKDNLNKFSDNINDLTNQMIVNAYGIDAYRIERKIEWQWLIAKGNITGTFPKRLAKLFLKEWGIKLDNQILGDIGNIYSQNANKDNRLFYMDFNDVIDWQAGDYGYSDSCYWGCHSQSKVMLNENGVNPVRFYEKRQVSDHYDYDNQEYVNEDVLIGVARAWLLPDLPRKGCAIIFNAYSNYENEKNIQLISIARMLSNMWGMSYKKIELSNYDSTTNDPWINDGSGYLIGSESDISGISSYDFEWDNENIKICDHCAESINIEDDNYYHEHGYIYCESCHDDLFSYCENCEEHSDSDNFTEVHLITHSIWGGNRESTRYICNGCLENGDYIECPDCNTWYESDMLHSLSDNEDNLYCEDCISNYPQCDNCGDYVTELNEHDLCEDCTSNCDHCNNPFPNDDIVYSEVLRMGLCPDCRLPEVYYTIQRDIELNTPQDMRHALITSRIMHDSI